MTVAVASTPVVLPAASTTSSHYKRNFTPPWRAPRPIRWFVFLSQEGVFSASYPTYYTPTVGQSRGGSRLPPHHKLRREVGAFFTVSFSSFLFIFECHFIRTNSHVRHAQVTYVKRRLNRRDRRHPLIITSVRITLGVSPRLKFTATRHRRRQRDRRFTRLHVRPTTKSMVTRAIN